MGVLVQLTLNCILDVLLIGHFSGGLAGAAWATVFAQWAGCLVTLWCLPRGNRVRRAPLHYRSGVQTELLLQSVLPLKKACNVRLQHSIATCAEVLLLVDFQLCMCNSRSQLHEHCPENPLSTHYLISNNGKTRHVAFSCLPGKTRSQQDNSLPPWHGLEVFIAKKEEELARLWIA